MKLFCPGPVMISENVANALVQNNIGHRSKDFENLFKRIKKNILKITNADNSYEAVILSSSGSSANEAVVASLFTTNDKVLILSNGSFGERISQLMKNYNINHTTISNEWGQPFEIDSLRNHLQNNEYDYMFISHDETSCGLINDLQQLGKLCHEFNIDFFVDCVSSLGSDLVDMKLQNISILTSVSGKAIGAVPGASFVVMKDELFQKMKNNKITSSYLNLYNYYIFSKEKNQSPNTPNINNFQALDVALIECIENNKSSRYKECSNYLRDEFEKMNIEFAIERSLMSNSVTTIKIPITYKVEDIYTKLYNKGFTTYLTRGIFKEQNCLQICVMGEIYLNDCVEFISTFKSIL